MISVSKDGLINLYKINQFELSKLINLHIKILNLLI